MPGRPPARAKRNATHRPPTSRRRRALGQHFLSNMRAARRIIEIVSPRKGDRVLEIGPGKGVLTALLLESGVSLVAVERDPRLAAGLRRLFSEADNLELMEADILTCDLSRLAGGRPLRVVANLPYAITGEILMAFFNAVDSLSDLTLMLQKEVVERIVSPPGNRVYGSLSVVAQYFSRPTLMMSLHPGSFSPPPDVSSAVVSMEVRAEREIPATKERDYTRFVQRVFGRRRQTLRNNLKAMGLAGANLDSRLTRAGIDPGVRPEALKREEFVRLFRTLVD